MKSALRLLLMILLFTPVFFDFSAVGEGDIEEIRAKYPGGWSEKLENLYEDEPLAAAPYKSGLLSEEALQAALDEVNFIRYLAGLELVALDADLNSAAQHAAVLMAANGLLSHDPAQPDDMEEGFYLTGSRAAACCNLASFNWKENDLLVQAIRQFSQDDSGTNREILGHRRWLLYPGMLYTGFGLAQDEEGVSYAAMYVMDDSRAEADYDMIQWPSEGAFPAEYLTVDTPWSISPNPDVYDLQKSNPRIVLTEETCGAQFVFSYLGEGAGEEQYFVAGGGRYGDGPAYIFQPALSEYNELMYGYQQNQIWNVRLEGMIRTDGSSVEAIEYTVRMMSLMPIDPAAVEISPRELSIQAGEQAQLTAQVIPQWADDLSVTWGSENEEIATVDENGVVSGVKAGSCAVTARSVNGRYDRIEVMVTE